MRNKLSHDYFGVDIEIVWRTATVNVPEALPLVQSAAGGRLNKEFAEDEPPSGSSHGAT